MIKPTDLFVELFSFMFIYIYTLEYNTIRNLGTFENLAIRSFSYFFLNKKHPTYQTQIILEKSVSLFLLMIIFSCPLAPEWSRTLVVSPTK